MVESISGYFAAPYWEPVCAVGSHDGAGVNAQICVSVFGSSIVPDRPRLLVVLWNSNYTRELALASRSLSVTLLSADQIDLIQPLGLESGRDGPKLEGTGFETTPRGNPYFPMAVGYADCDVLDAHDLGDATLFVCAVREEQRTSDRQPLTWSVAQKLLNDEFLDRYRETFAGDVDRSRRQMHWE